jgi:transposase
LQGGSRTLQRLHQLSHARLGPGLAPERSHASTSGRVRAERHRGASPACWRLLPPAASRIDRIAAPWVSNVPLPPCSPDLHPIEKVFAELNTSLRKAAERTVEAA